MFVILVYDVKQSRVGKVLKICRKYLTWVQNSVFEGEITPANLEKLKYEISKVIDSYYDSVIIYKLDLKPKDKEILGSKPPSSEDLIF